jgi:hypothetical protein
MGFSIKGWPEGHPQLTRIDGYPFGYAKPQCSDPTSEESRRKRDGYTASFNSLYDHYRQSAADRGLLFDISKKDFWLLTSQPCFVCAAPPSQGKSKRHKNPYIYNGIDRLDSSEGYRLGNVVGCCWAHNRIKGNLTYREFFKHCLAVVLSELSKTAAGCNDIATLERLIDLFPNVRFLQEHHVHVWKELKHNPKALVLTAEMAQPRDRRVTRLYPDRPNTPVANETLHGRSTNSGSRLSRSAYNQRLPQDARERGTWEIQ